MVNTEKILSIAVSAGALLTVYWIWKDRQVRSTSPAPTPSPAPSPTPTPNPSPAPVPNATMVEFSVLSDVVAPKPIIAKINNPSGNAGWSYTLGVNNSALLPQELIMTKTNIVSPSSNESMNLPIGTFPVTVNVDDFATSTHYFEQGSLDVIGGSPLQVKYTRMGGATWSI